MNPYASFLDGSDARAIILATPQRIRSLMEQLDSDARRQPPSPGKWSFSDIVCHLADTELVFAFRLRQARAEPHHVIQPFDQDKWAQAYGLSDDHAAMAVFSAVREWNLAFIAALTPEDLAKPVTHPERGQMTLQTVVETMAGHDLNHLGQLAAIYSNT